MSKQQELAEALAGFDGYISLSSPGRELRQRYLDRAALVLKTMREPSPLMTEAMAAEAAAIRRRMGYVASYRDLYQAGIDAEIAQVTT